jgi:four helix bundle protein
LQFLGHARGSLYEIETQIVIAERLKYLAMAQSDNMLAESRELGRVLNALIGSLKPLSAASIRRELTTDN